MDTIMHTAGANQSVWPEESAKNSDFFRENPYYLAWHGFRYSNKRSFPIEFFFGAQE
jgi:hypothetical protein